MIVPRESWRLARQEAHQRVVGTARCGGQGGTDSVAIGAGAIVGEGKSGRGSGRVSERVKGALACGRWEGCAKGPTPSAILPQCPSKRTPQTHPDGNLIVCAGKAPLPSRMPYTRSILQ